MGAQELSTLLWHERGLLELLLFKLEEEQLVMTSGKTRWLQHATSEVEQVIERLRLVSLARAVEVTGIAEQWGLSADATLRQLVTAAPGDGPWKSIMQGHLQALVDLTNQIQHVRDANAQFLNAASRSAQETLAGIDMAGVGYDAAAGLAPVGAAPHRLFETIL